jgi:hypothetical protein
VKRIFVSVQIAIVMAYCFAAEGQNTNLPAGPVVAWGIGVYDYRLPPIAAGTTFTAVAGGSAYTLALTSDGKVITWGANDYGQFVPMPDLSGVLKISAGGAHNLALKSNGTVFAWGTIPPDKLPFQRISAASLPLRQGEVTVWRSSRTVPLLPGEIILKVRQPCRPT